MDIEWFGPQDASAIDDWLEVREAVRRVDSPWRHPATRADAVGRFTHGWDGEPSRPLLARQRGEVVAWGSVGTTERDNRHLADIDLFVHPDHRGRGVGGRLLAVLEDAVRAAGRTSVVATARDAEPVASFAAGHGYTRVSAFAIRRQTLADVDPAVLGELRAEAAARAADYVLERWPVPTDPDRIEALAVLAGSINDAPTDELDIEDEVFDADRTRAYEAAQSAQGQRLLRLVARHRETGELAGQTVVAVDGERPELGDQHDTTVVAAHRGHRLGMLLKVGMLDWMAESEPQVRTVDTGNAVSNDFMISVNEALGYRLMGVDVLHQRRLD